MYQVNYAAEQCTFTKPTWTIFYSFIIYHFSRVPVETFKCSNAMQCNEEGEQGTNRKSGRHVPISSKRWESREWGQTPNCKWTIQVSHITHKSQVQQGCERSSLNQSLSRFTDSHSPAFLEWNVALWSKDSSFPRQETQLYPERDMKDVFMLQKPEIFVIIRKNLVWEL